MTRPLPAAEGRLCGKGHLALPGIAMPNCQEIPSPRVCRALPRMLLAGGFLPVAGEVFAFPQSSAQGDLPVLTQAVEVRSLGADQARQEYRVRQRGVISHRRPQRGVTWRRSFTPGECCPNVGVTPPSWRLLCRLEAGATVQDRAAPPTVFVWKKPELADVHSGQGKEAKAP